MDKKVVGGTYRMKEAYFTLDPGDEVVLIYDDNSDMPLFKSPKVVGKNRGIENSVWIHMDRVELLSGPKGKRAAIDDPKELASFNNSGGSDGRCVACGIPLTPWGGGMGWYCTECEK